MAIKIGGPSATSLFTWGSVRAPLILYNDSSIGNKTTYSRAYPVTADGDYPKIFIWESGSLFSWNRIGARPPYYYIEYFYKESTDTYGARFSVGIWPDSAEQRVDNLQFSELLGEEVTTDVGDFNITQDAHQIVATAPTWQFIEGLDDNSGYPRILTIGKLTPI
jgi:hypothetical protein